MKTPDEIKNRLETEELDLKEQFHQYECVGDYIRGWVNALKWVTEQSKGE